MSITRTILQRIPSPNLPGYESRLVRLEYPGGFASPPHNHPVAAIGYVVEGEVISQWEGSDESEHYKAGDAFFDHGETLHVGSENARKDVRLVTIVNYVIKVDEANVKMV